MSCRPIARAALLSAATFATFATLAVSAVYASTPPAPAPGSTGSAATFEVRCDETRPEIRCVLKLYPADAIYFGDAIYVVSEEENRSSKTIPNWLNAFYGDLFDSLGSISSPDISGSYDFLPEKGSSAHIDFAPQFRDFLPGEKKITSRRTVDFPPLEDWNAPFWKELREKLRDKPEGIVCNLSINSAYRDKNRDVRFETVDLKIVVKPRPNGETERIQRWYDATPPELFPRAEETRKVPRDGWLKSSGKSDIEIGGRRYDPWLFIRLGNRKPSDPNNPTTLDGWRALEAEFAPSTLRDEITLTRLQLEYYNAPKGPESDAALQTLLDWLSRRPETQRRVLERRPLSREFELEQTPLKEKLRKLAQELRLAPNLDAQPALPNFLSNAPEEK
ncbi:MAG: hypothetical protein IJZ10_03040 [Thermoguttaceae bacterium]|nr:hypothetical protein [Thermoguttaceae bacterium]